MRSKPDGCIYGYNAGAVVDEAHQVIVATTSRPTPPTPRSLPALVDQVETNTGRRPKRLLADAGYQSDDNLAHLADQGIDAYVAVRRDKHSAVPPAAPRGRIPALSAAASGWPASCGPRRATPTTPGARSSSSRSSARSRRPWASAGSACGARRRSPPSGISSAPSMTWPSCSAVAGRAGHPGWDRPTGCRRPSDGSDGDRSSACPDTTSAASPPIPHPSPFGDPRAGDYERGLLGVGALRVVVLLRRRTRSGSGAS